jgi:hypothetical protein
MAKLKIPQYIPEPKLKHFDSYADFLNYSESLFDLTAEQHQSLFKVLVKLESVGEDAVDTIDHCKFEWGEADCLELIKFMIQVEAMDMADLSQPA